MNQIKNCKIKLFSSCIIRVFYKINITLFQIKNFKKKVWFMYCATGHQNVDELLKSKLEKKSSTELLFV